jgi:hypothetical protein
MCTPQVALMDLDRGTLARIDRKLLAGLSADEAYRTLRVPADAAKWSTWKRYCDSLGISMGRAITALIEHELGAVVGRDREDRAAFGAEMERKLPEDLNARERTLRASEQRLRTLEQLIRRSSHGSRPPRRSDAKGGDGAGLARVRTLLRFGWVPPSQLCGYGIQNSTIAVTDPPLT